MTSRRIATIALAVYLTTIGLRTVEVRAADASHPRAKSRKEAVLLEEPRYGVYYDRYEPTFYTGFAPRALRPEQIHLHIGRGNQLRVTIALTDDIVESYARDLAHRHATYQRLIDRKQIVLTQNTAFESFAQTLADVGLEQMVAREHERTRRERRQSNLELLERLNPGRVFHIRIPVDELVRRWAAELRPEDRAGREIGRDRQLDLLNALLPTRLWTTEIAPGTAKRLHELIAAMSSTDALDAAAIASVAPRYLALLDEVGHGLYPRQGDALEFAEFTAIYPIGSLNATTDYRGREIPLYPTPGRRALTTHQRTKTVDHIPDVQSYSYSPWIPYMHVGPRMHNAFHTLYWQMDTAKTRFLPEAWRTAVRDSRSGAPQRYLWLLSRGPMSHGCTHVNAGHIAELRQMLPASTEDLYQVDTFLNRSYDYDVFDIDGDLTPEVIGVRYFIAFDLFSEERPLPNRLRVANERTAYYDWLYAGDLRLDADGRGTFENVYDGRFVERNAEQGRVYQRLSLYEASYEPERIQFYELVDIPFARRLRQVALNHPFPSDTSIASR